jgi:two-component system, chemotaxis family, protein-glutamate methylesterase/glutaminase
MAAPATIVGIGASAGGVEALRALVADLPEDLEAALLVVLHIAPDAGSMLAGILDRTGPLPVRTADDGEPIEAGTILVAPPDRHLRVEDGHVRLSAGPRENGHRPAVDPLLRSLATALGERAVGVILSGTRDDGTAGLAAIKLAGGRTLVQDPAEATYPGMPQSAIDHVDVDAVLPLAGIVEELAALHFDPGPSHPGGGPGEAPARAGTPTRVTCPACGGVLHEHEVGHVVQYRCSVGHKYATESLDFEHGEMVDGALWEAMRMLDDRAALLDSLANRHERRGSGVAARYRRRASVAHGHVEALRTILEEPDGEAAA